LLSWSGVAAEWAQEQYAETMDNINEIMAEVNAGDIMGAIDAA